MIKNIDFDVRKPGFKHLPCKNAKGNEQLNLPEDQDLHLQNRNFNSYGVEVKIKLDDAYKDHSKHSINANHWWHLL